MPDELISPGDAVATVETVRTHDTQRGGRIANKSDHDSGIPESLLVTVILALFGTSFVVQAFKIPSPSMEKTLLVGDHLLVNKFIFGGRGHWYDRLLPYRDLQRGDIIVFKFPYQDHPHFVKRVIGLPGDHLKVVDQQVYVNGNALNEPYVVHDSRVRNDPLNYSFHRFETRFILSRRCSRNGHTRLKIYSG
jgi:signal peptidase I